MKKTLALAALCAAALLPAQENPAYKMFAKDILFSANFDDGTCNADMASGEAEPLRIGGKAEFPAGLFGKALANGNPLYKGEKNIDMTVPGTLLRWTAPRKGTTAPAKTDPGFTVFHTMADGYEMIVGKMGGQPWGQGHLNTYIQYDAGRGGAKSCVIYGAANAAKWPNGEWRMLAVTWGAGSITNSINGKKSEQAELKSPLKLPVKMFFVNTEGDMLVDEVIVLRRRLSDDEIAKVYAETMKALPKK